MGIWALPSVFGNNQTHSGLLPEAFALEVLRAQGKGQEDPNISQLPRSRK